MIGLIFGMITIICMTAYCIAEMYFDYKKSKEEKQKCDKNHKNWLQKCDYRTKSK